MDIYYPLPDINNDKIDVWWEATPGSKDHQLFTARAAVDNATTVDSKLLANYQAGQYLTIEKTDGYLSIAEISLTFDVMRKNRN